MRKKWETAAKRGGEPRDNWCTSEEGVRLVHELLGRPFDLDPCGSEKSLLCARSHYLIERGEDGLTLPWIGTCFFNPPFSKLRAFVAKAHAEYVAGRATEIVGLMPSRTDTIAFHNHVAPSAAAVCFYRGRMTFVGAPDPAPFPIMFPYWGPRVAEFERVFGRAGLVVRLPEDPTR